MKKMFFIAALAVVTFTAQAQQTTSEKRVAERATMQLGGDESKTLYLIDGKPVSKQAVDQLPAESIQNMNVMRGVESVVLITTHSEAASSGSSHELTTIRIAEGESGKITINKELNGKTVYVRSSEIKALQLVKHPDGKIEVLENINVLQPEQIQSIAVYKSEDQTEQFKQYGDTSNGVIYIELKE